MKKRRSNIHKAIGKKTSGPRGFYKLSAQLIGSARRRHKLSQKQLAHHFEYHPQYIANWEAGVSLPPVDTLKRLSKVLKIPLMRFIELRTIEYKKKLLEELRMKYSSKKSI